jgi:hypothetical protein
MHAGRQAEQMVVRGSDPHPVSGGVRPVAVYSYQLAGGQTRWMITIDLPRRRRKAGSNLEAVDERSDAATQEADRPCRRARPGVRVEGRPPPVPGANVLDGVIIWRTRWST